MLAIQEHLDRVHHVLAERYAGLRELARGKNGIVLSAHRGDPRGPALALKVAYPVDEGTEEPDSVLRFRRECEIGSALNHPHILRVSRPTMEDGVEFCEMEFVGPMRLDQLVTAPKPPSFRRVLDVMHELADALDYAHAHGVVHGALTPSRVLLDAGGHVHVKGFMLLRDVEATHPALTPAAVGNSAFMAPEQWKLPAVNRSVDVYAAGILAWELCTGVRRVSMDGSGIPEIRPITIPPDRPLRDGIPLYVNAAIRRATSRDPVNRFATVGEFVAALSNPAKALGASQPTLRPVLYRRRTSLTMPLAIVLAIATVVGLAVPSAPRERALGWLKTSVESIRTAGAIR